MCTNIAQTVDKYYYYPCQAFLDFLSLSLYRDEPVDELNQNQMDFDTIGTVLRESVHPELTDLSPLQNLGR